jgi:hypothetical protein
VFPVGWPLVTELFNGGWSRYLGVIFDKKITWRLHIETIEVKTFRALTRICALFKSERLSTNMDAPTKDQALILI